MAIRVGTIINVINAWNIYNQKVKAYTQKKSEAKAWGDVQKAKYWQDTIDMTKAEMEEFKEILIPDPIPSKQSAYLSQDYDILESRKVDIKA